MTLFFISVLILSITPFVNAEVWNTSKDISEPTDVFIPTHEYVGFFDSNDIYTVVGNVKNNLDYSVTPTVLLSVMGDSQKFTRTIQLDSLVSGNEIPFKIKFPEISIPSLILLPAEISFQKTITHTIPVDVIYDQSLIVHDDGHLTGRIINSGTETISNIEILAIIHGFEHETLDMGKSVLPIINLKPGEIREFSMYPDTSVADNVWYYSCFAIGTDTVVVLNTQRNAETFDIRYDSGILISYPEFDESGTELSFWLNKGWPLPEYFINFEFPRYSDNENFSVYLEKNQIKSIQSMDEWGNWHVSFHLEDNLDGNLVIKGFDPDVTSPTGQFIPEWIKYDAHLWSQGLLSDESFVTGIKYLINYGVIEISIDDLTNSNSTIPDWIQTYSDWWYQGLISNEEFVISMEFLINSKIILIN